MSSVDKARLEPAPICPTCQGELRQVSHGTYGGDRRHAELYLFECPQHGDVFLTREGLAGPNPGGTSSGTGGADTPPAVPRDSPAAPAAGPADLPLPGSD
jgi:hypothetical protein